MEERDAYLVHPGHPSVTQHPTEQVVPSLGPKVAVGVALQHLRLPGAGHAPSTARRWPPGVLPCQAEHLIAAG